MAGMRPYVVRQGEYLTRIAFSEGFDADAVWNHPKNDALRKRRTSPEMLAPSDILFIPDERAAPMRMSVGVDNDYAAKVPTVPLKLALRVGGEPVPPGPFVAWDEATATMVARGDVKAGGELTLSVPVTAREVGIKVGDPGFFLRVAVGRMDPPDEATGARARLANLGYLLGDEAVDSAAFADGVGRFQRDRSLPETRSLGEETLDALEKRHGV